MGARAPEVITFEVRGPITRADLPGLCDRVCALLAQAGARWVDCDVATVEPNATTVDALARLQLAARRHGCRVRLRNGSAELQDLVTFMGLSEVFPE